MKGPFPSPLLFIASMARLDIDHIQEDVAIFTHVRNENYYA